MVLQCLEIVGVLDAARLDQPNCIEKIYAIIFNGPSKESFEVSMVFLDIIYIQLSFDISFCLICIYLAYKYCFVARTCNPCKDTSAVGSNSGKGGDSSCDARLSVTRISD